MARGGLEIINNVSKWNVLYRLLIPVLLSHNSLDFLYAAPDQDGIEDVAMCVCDVRRMLKPGER